MSNDATTEHDQVTEADSGVDHAPPHIRRLFSVRGGLVGGTVAAKTADGLVTAVALTTGAGTERNPVAASVFEAVGVLPGVVGLTLLALAVAVGGIEAAASRAPGGRVTPTVVRVCGYGPLALVWSLVTLHNAAILAL